MIATLEIANVYRDHFRIPEPKEEYQCYGNALVTCLLIAQNRMIYGPNELNGLPQIWNMRLGGQYDIEHAYLILPLFDNFIVLNKGITYWTDQCPDFDVGTIFTNGSNITPQVLGEAYEAHKHYSSAVRFYGMTLDKCWNGITSIRNSFIKAMLMLGRDNLISWEQIPVIIRNYQGL